MNNYITQSKLYRRCNHPTSKWVFFFVELEYDMFFSGALARSGAPLVRKFGNLCIQEILVLGRKNNICYENTIQVVLNQLCSSLWTSRSWYGVRPYVRPPLHVSGSKNGTPNTICWKLGIGHPCYSQLTAVKKGYPLTSVTWLHRGLRYTSHGVFRFRLIAGSGRFFKDKIQFAHCLR